MEESLNLKGRSKRVWMRQRERQTERKTDRYRQRERERGRLKMKRRVGRMKRGRREK